MKKELTLMEEQSMVLRIATMFSMYCENLDGNGEDDIRELLEMVDLGDLMETGYLSIIKGQCDFKESMINALRKFISCLNYLENETSIPTPVSDDIYDRVLELVRDYDDKQQPIGTPTNSITKGGVRPHRYPELRGSLKKVYFCERDEIPKYDSRKSMEDYLRSVFENYPSDIWDDGFGGTSDIRIHADFKYDGQAGVFECNDNDILNVLTRYKVEQNLGKDISHIFAGETVKSLFGPNVPFGYTTSNLSYGIQVEIVMTEKQFLAYQEYTNDKKCNRRSAVSSILNRTKDNFDPKLRDFLTVIPLQVSSEGNGAYEIFEESCCPDYLWISLGYMGERFLWVSIDISNHTLCTSISKDYLYSLDKKERYCVLSKELCNKMAAIKSHAKELGIPIDGMVFTIMNYNIKYQLSEFLGRNKNNFQVAFKFPARVAKTTVKEVEFRVGPLGNITPVVEFEPVVIDGAKLSHVNLSNMDKLERLRLHVGDEILIQYDIIPKIIDDETCKKNENTPQIRPITKCPICGEALDEKIGYRCTNWKCASKIVGRIFNYTRKMRIPGFGLEIIEMLNILGVLNSIRDLYSLGNHIKQIVTQHGCGNESVKKLVNAPLSRTHIFPHELLGSLGIPSISLQTMEKVCRIIPLEKLVNAPEIVVKEYPNIPHVGEKTAIKIAHGLEQYKEEILTLIPWFTFKSYNNQKSQHVVFHMVRDKKFEQWLLSEKGINTTSGITDAVALIVSDGNLEDTDKIKRARDNHIPILPISEAKKMWGYDE